MANTTFGQLKINCLNRAGNNYNANDSVMLAMAGQIINEVMGEINSLIKGHPFTLDTGNTVSTVAAAPGTALAQTDILEILQVYQRDSKTKLKQITWQQYIAMLPDPTVFSGISDLFWVPVQEVNVSGVNIWTIYTLPTPASIQTMYFDYVKDLAFSADTGVDGEFCKLPRAYDYWIIAEAKPKIWGILDPKNTRLIQEAEADAAIQRTKAMRAILSQVDRTTQVGSQRQIPTYRNPVPTITPP